MTIYARPGTSGSIVPLKTRYENFIGGDWTKPLKGNYAEDDVGSLSPGGDSAARSVTAISKNFDRNTEPPV